MSIIELTKSIIPTRNNKLRHAERYKLSQDILHKRRASESSHKSEYTYEDHIKLVNELERRQNTKSPLQNKRESIMKSFFDWVYLHATRNWPTDPGDLMK